MFYRFPTSVTTDLTELDMVLFSRDHDLGVPDTPK